MKNPMRIAAVLLLASCGAGELSPETSSDALQKAIAAMGPSFQELFDDAELVVTGNVQSKAPRALQFESGEYIMATAYRVTVGETLKGSAAQAEIEVVVLGGESGDLVETVSRQPTIRVGSEALFFLARRHDAYRPIDELAVRDLRSGELSVVESAAMKRWPGTTVNFEVKTKNRSSLRDSEVLNDVRQASETWHKSTRANIKLVFSARVLDGPKVVDQINSVAFGTDSSWFVNVKKSVATTTTRYRDGKIEEVDIIFNEKTFTFFHSGSNNCKSGHYLLDIATHEFGHALGLPDTSNSSDTMFGSGSPCSTNLRTLEPADAKALESLYGRR